LFSFFPLPDPFRAEPRAPIPIFRFRAPELVFGGTGGVRSLFHVFCSRIRFRQYRGRRVSFSCFAIPDPFWVVPRPSGPVFMFGASGLVLGATEDVGSRFHVLRPRTHFRQLRRSWVPFSCFVLVDSFLLVPRTSGVVFIFSAPGHISGGTEGADSNFQVSRSRTRFWRYRGRLVPFSCFSLPDSFLSVLRASGTVFMFCVPRLVLGATKCV
jgi:hypothetical protein